MTSSFAVCSRASADWVNASYNPVCSEPYEEGNGQGHDSRTSTSVGGADVGGGWSDQLTGRRTTAHRRRRKCAQRGRASRAASLLPSAYACPSREERMAGWGEPRVPCHCRSVWISPAPRWSRVRARAGRFRDRRRSYSRTANVRRNAAPGVTEPKGTTPLFPRRAETVPDIVVVEDEVEALMWIALAYLHATGGERVQGSTAVLQATCVDCAIVPYLEQRLNFTCGCDGCRDATDLGRNEAARVSRFDGCRTS